MEEIPSLNMPVQRLKVAILPLDLTCTGPVTKSGEILTIGKSQGKKPERFISQICIRLKCPLHGDRPTDRCDEVNSHLSWLLYETFPQKTLK